MKRFNAVLKPNALQQISVTKVPQLLAGMGIATFTELFHTYIRTDSRSPYSNVVGKGKRKVRPCTGTEALYRPYGP